MTPTGPAMASPPATPRRPDPDPNISGPDFGQLAAQEKWCHLFGRARSRFLVMGRHVGGRLRVFGSGPVAFLAQSTDGVFGGMVPRIHARSRLWSGSGRMSASARKTAAPVRRGRGFRPCVSATAVILPRRGRRSSGWGRGGASRGGAGYRVTRPRGVRPSGWILVSPGAGIRAPPAPGRARRTWPAGAAGLPWWPCRLPGREVARQGIGRSAIPLRRVPSFRCRVRMLRSCLRLAGLTTCATGSRSTGSCTGIRSRLESSRMYLLFSRDPRENSVPAICSGVYQVITTIPRQARMRVGLWPSRSKTSVYARVLSSCRR